MAWCVSPAISNASLLLLLWKITLHFTEIIVHFITKFVNCDSYEDSSIRFSCLIVLSLVFESRQNWINERKDCLLSCGTGIFVDVAGHIPITMAGWWGTITRTAELSKHCGRVLIKGAGFSLSLFVSNAITRLLLIDIGMTLSLWKYLATPPRPSPQECGKSFPSLSNPITHTEAQMSTLKAVNFFLSFL